MRTSITKTIYSILCLAVCTHLCGSHILGGEASYKFLSFNADSTEITYSVSFTIYRDKNGIDYEPFASFGIYKMLPNNEWNTHSVITGVPIKNIFTYSATSDPCSRQTSTNIGVESGIYTFEVTLPVYDNYYKIAYQKCCRNHTINNIQNAGITGAVYDVKISPHSQKVANSSPTFVDLPPSFICVNEPINYRHKAKDVDGDDIRYSFCAAYVAGGIESYEPTCCDCQNPVLEYCPPPYDQVIYNTPYTSSNPLGGAPQVQIDSITGVISGTPNTLGAFVVGVCVEERRNGVVLSRTRRDFEFNVVPCLSMISASLVANDSTSTVDNEDVLYKYSACRDTEIDILNSSVDEQFIEDYTWTISDPSGAIIVNESGLDNRDYSLEFSDSGIYSGLMILNDKQLCSDTAYFEIDIFQNISPQFSYEFDPCSDTPVYFTDDTDYSGLNIEQWEWDFGDGQVSSNQHADHQFDAVGTYQIILTLTDENQCQHITERTLDWYPNLNMEGPEIIQESTKLCPGDSTLFFGEWLFEAGQYEHIIKAENTDCDSIRYKFYLDLYNQPVEIINKAYLCPGETLIFDDKIVTSAGIYEYYRRYENADCDSLHEQLIVSDSELPILNLLSDTTIYINSDYSIPLDIQGSYENIEWTPRQKVDCVTCMNPNINQETNQSFNVKVTNENGCYVEKSINIKVTEEIHFFLPNVIAAKEVQRENTKLFVQSNKSVKYRYDLEIFDRYGNLIHQCLDATCNDDSKAWTPENINPGVFVYVINFIEENFKESIVGSITVLE